MSYRNYKIKLDTARNKTNKDMSFYISDIQSDQFTLTITEKGQVFDVQGFVLALIAVSPKNVVSTQYIDTIDSNVCTIKLERQMMNEVGQWTCRAALFNDECTLILDSFTYTVHQDELTKVGEAIQQDDRFPLLMQLLNDNKLIEEAEKQRVISENERITNEQQRAADEEIRQSKEVNRQQSEISRNQHEQQRIEAEQARIENEEQRQSNEAVRQETYTQVQHDEQIRQSNEAERIANHNIMIESEERRNQQADAHKAAEEQRAVNEQQRISQETERKTAEVNRASNEVSRQQNEVGRNEHEQVRQDNEVNRQSNEQVRQSNYNALIDEMNTSKDEFNAYTEQAKVNEEQRKADEIIRQQEEQTRADNEVERMSNEGTRKANEQAREKNETSRKNIFENKVDEVDKKIVELNTTKDNFISSVNTKVDTKISELDNAKSDMTTTVSNKVNEVETRFNALTSKQQQDAEVIDARDGETSLKARLDRDIEKAKQIYASVEGSYISTDSSSGYLKDVEILGNTIQDASNLADIRSVGDKVEGQELYKTDVVSCGKNIFNGELELGGIFAATGEDDISAESWRKTSFIRFEGANLTHSLDEIGNKYLFEYDNKFNFVRYTPTSDRTHTFNISSETKYIKITYDFIPTKDIQIEEGTVATPYEPYQEDKLTILSPVQLEKVGDIADRIICKDGVWGVEKNVKTMYTKEFASLIGTYEDKGDTHKWGLKLDTPKTFLLTNFLQTGTLSAEPTQTQVMLYNHVTHREFRIAFKKSDFPNFDVKSNVVDYLSNETRFIKIVQQPQFIPLPHDQQVKLRTFANKTNISFLTEIEGTIKAQVPKSLGATVNTHTEQINNLNKELDRVKKLEESTVSTVTTESDFTSVEATSNGYFEDVKLEGKTLVNLSDINAFSISGGGKTIYTRVDKIKPNTTYTRIVYITKNTLVGTNEKGTVAQLNVGERLVLNKDIQITQNFVGLLDCSKYTISDIIEEKFSAVRVFSVNTGGVLEGYEIILEGDHTQNPPSYFEGLKSVGQSATTSEDGADEIVVSSNNNQPKQIETTDDNSITTTIDNPNYQSDKKRLLFYNNETQAWEKPILREWDSIEKHADGKYYYHKRSGEVVLNGSEKWIKAFNFTTPIYSLNQSKCGVKNNGVAICDKYTNKVYSQTASNHECIYLVNISNEDAIRIQDASSDVDAFKSKLQANNVTVVYQLAQEKVYECTNIDLITYNGETNYIVNSGAIVPRTTLKVMSNISNVVRKLQEKVSTLEQNESKFMQILRDLINK